MRLMTVVETTAIIFVFHQCCFWEPEGTVDSRLDISSRSIKFDAIESGIILNLSPSSIC
jgi:hypothetical protein